MLVYISFYVMIFIFKKYRRFQI